VYRAAPVTMGRSDQSNKIDHENPPPNHLIPLLQLVPRVRRRPALMPAILNVAAPAMFWVAVLVAPWMWPGVSTFGQNFDGETGLSVAGEFGFWMLALAAAFGGLGGVCGVGLGMVYPGVRVVDARKVRESS
jgi:hypothetical protein